MTVIVAFSGIIMLNSDSYADPEDPGEEPTVTARIIIEWDDEDNAEGIRPDSVHVSLVGEEIIISENDDWSGSVDVPESTDIRTWVVDAVDGYTCSKSNIDDLTTKYTYKHFPPPPIPDSNPVKDTKTQPSETDDSDDKPRNDDDNGSDNKGGFVDFMNATDQMLNNELNKTQAELEKLKKTGITIEAGNWVSFKREVYEKIDKLSALGIPVTIRYNYQKTNKSVTIPAYNNKKIPTVNMCNSEGYCGFEYLTEVLITGRLRPLNMQTVSASEVAVAQNAANTGALSSVSLATATDTDAAFNAAVDKQIDDNLKQMYSLLESGRLGEANALIAKGFVVNADTHKGFDRVTLEKLGELSRAGVAVTVNFTYSGVHYSITIPGKSEIDPASLIDENGYCGFLNLLKYFG